MTNASWRLINWLSEYAELMLMLRSEASKIYCAMGQMYEFYLLHVFYTFSSYNLADIVTQEQQQQVRQPESKHTHRTHTSCGGSAAPPPACHVATARRCCQHRLVKNALAVSCSYKENQMWSDRA